MAERADTSDPEVVRLRERMAKAEWRHEAMEERLSQGAESFSDLRNSITEVRKDLKQAHEKFTEAMAPKPIPVWKVAGIALTVCTLAASVVWMFARYPDRAEFNQAQKEHTEAHKELEGDLDEVRATQRDLATDQRLIKASQETTKESLDKIDRKLDKLLEPTP